MIIKLILLIFISLTVLIFCGVAIACILRDAKKYDELLFMLFEKCGYSKEEALELNRLGVIEGERCTSTIYNNGKNRS